MSKTLTCQVKTSLLHKSTLSCVFQTLPSERRCDQLRLVVCVCIPHHGADAATGLVLAPDPLRWLQVSHLKKPLQAHLHIKERLYSLYSGCSFWRTWGCGAVQSEKERAAYEVIRDEHRRLGPMSYAECSVLALFTLMVVLWFTRDPRFMDGWATHVFNAKGE